MWWGPQKHKKDLDRNEVFTNWNKEQFTGNNSRVDDTKNQINDFKHKEEKNNQSGQEKRIQKNEGSLSSLWDNLKKSNICIIGVPEGGQQEQETGNLFEKNNERKLS